MPGNNNVQDDSKDRSNKLRKLSKTWHSIAYGSDKKEQNRIAQLFKDFLATTDVERVKYWTDAAFAIKNHDANCDKKDNRKYSHEAIGEFLGKGSYGKVHACLNDPSLAIKCATVSFNGNPLDSSDLTNSLKDVLVEVANSVIIGDNNIGPAVYDAWLIELSVPCAPRYGSGTMVKCVKLFLQMDRVMDCSLLEYVAKRRLPYTPELFDAIKNKRAQLESLGFSHIDLCPRNIMVHLDGKKKVEEQSSYRIYFIDFASSKPANEWGINCDIDNLNRAYDSWTGCNFDSLCAKMAGNNANANTNVGFVRAMEYLRNGCEGYWQVMSPFVTDLRDCYNIAKAAVGAEIAKAAEVVRTTVVTGFDE